VAIEDLIRQHILEELLFDQPHAVLTNDDELLEKKIIDSMALVQLISFIEEQYGIEVDDEDLKLENFKTINHIKKYIESKRRFRP
jgi:acyl carrier protein